MTASDDYLRGKDVGEVLGSQKVVEWLLRYNHPILTKRSNCLIPSDKWQAKLKEWGIKREDQTRWGRWHED